MLKTRQLLSYSKKDPEIFEQITSQLRRQKRHGSPESELFYYIGRCGDCRGGDLELEKTIKKIAELLESVNINSQDTDGDTFLHAAIKEKNLKIAEHVLQAIEERYGSVSILNEEGKTPYDLIKREHDFSPEWKIFIKNLEHLNNFRFELVIETLYNDNYEWQLTPQDIAGVVRIEYKWFKQDTNLVLGVIGLDTQLEEQLKQHTKLKESNKQSLTFIFNLEQDRWVTIVIAYPGQQFFAYYIDSLTPGVPNNIRDRLEKEITGINIQSFDIKQQTSKYDSGIFALKNARIINEALRNTQRGQIKQELLKYQLTEEQLRDERIKFAKELEREEFIKIIRHRRLGEEGKLEKIIGVFEKYSKLDINFPMSTTDDTPLHVVIRRKEGKIVKFLAEKGADINFRNSKGLTPLDVAQHNGDEDILQILRQLAFQSQQKALESGGTHRLLEGVDVPGDGSCLFWSVALAYLTPVEFEDDAFSERCEKLFGKDINLTVRKQIKYGLIGREQIKSYKNIDENETLKNLVTKVFRNRVIEEMRSRRKELIDLVGMEDLLNSHNEDFFTKGKFQKMFNAEFNNKEVQQYGVDTSKFKLSVLDEGSKKEIGKELDKVLEHNPLKAREFRFKAYLDCMKDVKAWGSEYEIGVMSKLLGTAIEVFDKSSGKFLLYNEGKKDYETIHLLYMGKRHYQFREVKYSALLSFVKRFVESFEMSLIIYSTFGKEARKVGRIDLEKIDGVDSKNVVRSIYGLPAYTGNRNMNYVRRFYEKGNLGNAKVFLNLSDLIETFKNKDYRQGFRKVLVNAGCDIFQSFEIQFKKIGFDKLSVLADYAVDRIIGYFIEKERNGNIGDSKIFEALISDQYSKGESKRKIRHYDIDHLYENVGIIEKKEGFFIFYKRDRQKDQYDKYGYRRLFIGEKLKNKIYDFDTKLEITDERFKDYEYTSDPQRFRDDVKDLLPIVNEEIRVPGVKRISDLVKKAKSDVLGEVSSLKKKISSLYSKRRESLANKGRKLTKNKDMSKSIDRTKKAESNLKVISLIESNLEGAEGTIYYSKLQEIFVDYADKIVQDSNEPSESQHIDEGGPGNYWPRLRKVIVGINKMKLKDAYLPVDEFTGRKEQIEDIYKKLQEKEGVVAITSKQAGVGKTQLARKYASKYKEDYFHIYEVNAQDLLSIKGSVASLIRNELAISIGKQGSLSGTKKTLFLFHGIQKEHVKKILDIRRESRGGFDFVYTSLDQDFENVEMEVELDTLKGEEAEALTKKILGIIDESEDEPVKVLVEKLKAFPLAIKQVAMYIRNKRIGNLRGGFEIYEYLAQYEDFDRRAPQNAEQNEYDRILSIVTEISMETIRSALFQEKNSKILNAMAYFGQDQIDRFLFLSWVEDVDELESIFQFLEKYGMVNAVRENEFTGYIMHESVKKAVRGLLDMNQEKQLLSDTMKLIDEVGIEYLTEEDINNFIPLLEYAKRHRGLIIENVYFLSTILNALNSNHRYKEVIKLEREAIDLSSMEDKGKLQIRYEVASAISGLGEYDKALYIFQDLKNKDVLDNLFSPLVLDKKILSIYLQQKRYEEALSYVRGDNFVVPDFSNGGNGKYLGNYLDIVVTISQTLVMQKKYAEAFLTLHYMQELADEFLLRESDGTYSRPFSIDELHTSGIKYTEVLARFFASQDGKEISLHLEMLQDGGDLPYYYAPMILFNKLQGVLKNQEEMGHLRNYACNIKDIDEVAQKRVRGNMLRTLKDVMRVQEEVQLSDGDPQVLRVRLYIALLRYYLGEEEKGLQELHDLQKLQEEVIGLNHPSTLETIDTIQKILPEDQRKTYLTAEIGRRRLLPQSEVVDLRESAILALRTILRRVESRGHSPINEDGPSLSEELPSGNESPLDPEDPPAKKRKISNQQLAVSSCLEQGNRKKKRSAADCLFSWDDIDEFNNVEDSDKRDVDKIKIDSERFLTYIKNSQDKRKSDQLIEFVGTISNTEGNHKYLLNKVIRDGGYVNYIRNDRINDLQHDILQQGGGLVKNSKLKSRLINAAGGIQLIRGIHGAGVSCIDGTTMDCGLSLGGIAWSFISQPIESVMVKITLKLVEQTGNTVGKVIAGTLGKQTKFAIQILGTKLGTTIAKGIAGVTTGVFDFVEAGMSTNNLVDCQNRENSDNPCGEKEIRDNIASISFSGVSFVSGVTLTAASMPVAGVIVGLVLMGSQAIYSGVSNIIEYKKYDTTHNEDLSTFLRTLVFLPVSGDVQHLKDRHEVVNSLASGAWRTLDHSSSHICAYAISFGEDSMDSKTSISPGYAEILMNVTNADTTSLSRVIPKLDGNATMICLPQITDQIYEKGLANSVPTAVHYCKNAMVVTDKRRTDNCTTIIYDLTNVNSGTVVGSNKFINEFMIFGGGALITGGNNTSNNFSFANIGFHGEIRHGQNSTNMFNFSALKDNDLFVEVGCNAVQESQVLVATKAASLYRIKNIRATNIESTDSGLGAIEYYLGRKDKRDQFVCESFRCPDFVVNSGGGLKNGFDVVHGCKTVIVSPYTKVQGIGNGYTLHVKTQWYQKENLSSIIDIDGMGTVNFFDNDLLSDRNEITYLQSNNTLSIKMGLDQDSHYTLDIKNYIGQSSNKANFILIDKNGSNIAPRIEKLESSTVKINSFVLHAKYSLDDFDAVENHYKRILNNNKSYKVFGIVEDKVQSQSNGTVPRMIFGSSGKDIINFDQGTMSAKGGNGSDMYVIGSVMKEREVIIDNDSDDKELDMVLVPEVPEEFSIQQRNLHLDCNGTNVQVKNYFQDNSYRHLIVMNNEKEIFIPYAKYTDSSAGSGKLILFLHGTQTQNMFFLSKAFQANHVAIDSRLEDIERYKDKDDLLLTIKSVVPFTIVIKDFYNDQSKWRDVNFLLWNDDNFSPYFGLQQEVNGIMDYQDKLKNDYEKIVKEYIIDFTRSINITHNQNDDLTPIGQDEERIGVLILKNITTDQIKIFSSNKDLVFSDKVSNHVINIKNWDNSESYRISTLEFDLGLDPIKIRRLERFRVSNVTEIHDLINIASENYRGGAAGTEMENYFKCLVSVDDFENRSKAYKCLGFSSLQGQIDFIENVCSLEQINKLKGEVSSDNQISLPLKKLENDLTLNGYDYSTVSECLNEVKKLIEKGADISAKNRDGLTSLNASEVVDYLEEGLAEQREIPAQRKRCHHHGDHSRYYDRSSRKLLATDLSNQPEIAASSGGRPSSWINDLFSWAKDSVGGLFSFRAALPRKPESSTVQSLPSVSQHNETAKGSSPSGFLSVENVALIGCVADALDNTQSKCYQTSKSQGVNFVPSIQTAVNFARREFDSFVEDKIRNLDSKEKARIRTEVKNAYPEIIESFRRGVEFSGNIGLDDVLEKCKRCFCTNILPNNVSQSENQMLGKTDDKPETRLSDVTVNNQQITGHTK